MAQVIKTTFQLRRGLSEIWEKNNPILAKGEPSFVVDKNALKIGDGVTPWKELEYIGLSQEDLAEAIEDYFKENPSGGTGGTINPEDIAAAVEDYLSKNPPEVPDFSDEVTRAETAATEAETASKNANTAMTTANIYRANAKTSETNAANSATRAEDAAKRAEDAAANTGNGSGGNAVQYTEQNLTDEQQVQVRENIGIEDVFTAEVAGSSGINLNDGVYEIGRFSTSGTEYDNEGNFAFRNVNYLPVEGGRTIVVYFDAAEWNGNRINWGVELVQYDSAKAVIGNKREYIENYLNNSESSFTLDANAAFIRIHYNRNGEMVFEDMTAPKIAIYYIEDAVQEFVEYGAGAETVLMVRRDRVQGLVALAGKKIVYDGDSICAGSAANAGGGYARIIADLTGGEYVNYAVGGGRLCSGVADRHCVADNLVNLPADGDIYCFQGGINDYWDNAVLGTYTPGDYTGVVDATTVCGALETIFRYALNNFPGKRICFVITHKVQNTAYQKNGAGNAFKDYRDAMAGICQKYSVPFYDAFSESGLNGWNDAQNNLYLTGNTDGTPDGCHPNEDGYRLFYVDQLIELFETGRSSGGAGDHTGGNVELDTTLKEEGKAADAKAVGDAISKLSGGGADGRGIVSIIRTEGEGAPGTVDTYTITYTDMSSSTFTVYNGKDGEDGRDGASFWIATFPIDQSFNQIAECEISGIQIPVSRELKEYDLILGTDGNVGIVEWIREGKVGIRRSQVILKGQPGRDGRGITSILKTSGDGTPGSIDTYTISYGENSTSAFTVYNGKDGKDGSATEGEQREPQVFQTTSFDLLPTTDVYIGDFGIVKTEIVDGKNSHTAFIYTENGWAALDGNYNANNVYFDEDLLVTTKIGTIQTLTNGQATLSAKGKTLKQVFSSLIAERKAPTATLPFGTIEWTNYENGNYLVEVGETITPTWKTTFSAGSYTYGPATGVAPVQAKVYLSTNSSSSSTIDAGEMNGKTGNLSALIVNDTSTKHYAKVEYGWTNGTSTPKDNFGDDHINTSKNLPIQAASGKTDTSTYYIQGYRKAFFGSRVSPIELTSHNIRSLASNANSSNASFTVTIDQGATQVVIAVPQGRVVKKVEDNGAFGQDILEAFDKYTNSSTINVGGADATSSNIGNYSAKYNVYVYNPSTPLGSNTYTVILDNE